MRPLFEYLNEGLIKRQAGVDIRAKIEDWLKERDIKNYKIKKDLTIDVKGDVVLAENDKEIPSYIQFGKISGDFWCNDCFDLESLKGCPKEVKGEFNCCNCPKLESLEGAPQKVGTWFDCSECDKLESLKGAPRKVGGGFYCTGCKNLKSLEGAPQKVGASFNCDYCGVKFTEDDVRKVCDVKGLIIL